MAAGPLMTEGPRLVLACEASDAMDTSSRLAAIGVAMREHEHFLRLVTVALMTPSERLEARDNQIREARRFCSAGSISGDAKQLAAKWLGYLVGREDCRFHMATRRMGLKKTIRNRSNKSLSQRSSRRKL